MYVWIGVRRCRAYHACGYPSDLNRPVPGLGFGVGGPAWSLARPEGVASTWPATYRVRVSRDYRSDSAGKSPTGRYRPVLVGSGNFWYLLWRYLLTRWVRGVSSHSRRVPAVRPRHFWVTACAIRGSSHGLRPGSQCGIRLLAGFVVLASPRWRIAFLAFRVGA